MPLTDYLPLSDLPDVRERAEELFSREMLGAVLVGKFVGDYTAIKTTDLLGLDLGYLAGIVATVGLFIYWNRAAQAVQEQSQSLRPAQTQLSDYGADIAAELDCEYLFVGGSQDWKRRNLPEILRAADRYGMDVHIGRPTIPEGILDAMDRGVTSVDTTSIVRTPAFEVLDLLEEQTGLDRFV